MGPTWVIKDGTDHIGIKTSVAMHLDHIFNTKTLLCLKIRNQCQHSLKFRRDLLLIVAYKQSALVKWC